MANRDVLSYRPHFLRDWDSSETVRLMSFAARGIYQALLDAQWEKGSIPAEPELCSRLLRCEAEEWAQFAEFFEHCFPKHGGRRKNKRLDDEREAVLAKVAKCREVGALGGKAKAKARAKATPEPEESIGEILANASETVERIGSHSDTDSDYSLANASGASDDAASSNVIDLEVLRSEPSELQEPEAIESEAGRENPYPMVERIMTAVAEAGDQPLPTPPMIRRHIGKASSILKLVEFCGERKATQLLVWCVMHKPRLGYSDVFSNVQSLLAEADKYRWGPPGSGARSGWGDPAEDIRIMTQGLTGGTA
ncbi:MAG: DUF1376 domain-containing protein [Armatimonadota bacterium]|nr:DUF1376 domain-containing protein [Fimbriimonadaceae bacterium]